jgi:hypothetical protein
MQISLPEPYFWNDWRWEFNGMMPSGLIAQPKFRKSFRVRT